MLGAAGTPDALRRASLVLFGWRAPAGLRFRARMNYSLLLRRLSKFLASAILILLFACSPEAEPMQITGKDINKDGRPDQFLYTLPRSRKSVLILADSTLDGKIDTFTWLQVDLDAPDKQEFFHSVSLRKEDRTSTWFGPGNLKLVAATDIDEDGVYDSLVYYNASARPGALLNIVARVETDSTGDGRVDAWIYAPARMEWEIGNQGRPNMFTETPTEVRANYAELSKPRAKRNGLTGRRLAPADSWALHPERIRTEQFRAVIPHSIFKEWLQK